MPESCDQLLNALRALHTALLTSLVSQLLIVASTLPAYSQHIHTHPFNDPLSRTTQVSQYQKGKTNLDFTEARDSEWQWHQLGHMQICTSLQANNHVNTPPLSFLQAGCPSCRPTNSVKALKEHIQSTDSRYLCVLSTPDMRHLYYVYGANVICRSH